MKAGTITVFLVAVLLAGCTYYQTAPGYYGTTPAPVNTFDSSWSAAVGAFEDQGVRIATEDRSAGFLRGTRDGIDVTANVRTHVDGSVAWSSTPPEPPHETRT